MNSLVTIIRPSLMIDSESVQTVRGVPSLGVAYLAGALKKENYRVKIIDGFVIDPKREESFYNGEFKIVGASVEKIINEIPKETLFVGISCLFSSEWLYHKELIKEIKAKRPDLKIVVGGEHITSDPQYVLETTPQIDIAVIGEGEETIIDICKYYEDKLDINEIDGIIYLYKGIVKKNNSRSRIKKIDEISWPDWDSYPLDYYMKNNLSLQETSVISIPMLGTRGCPYKCTFCTNLNMWGIQWISRDPADIVKEIKYYVEKYQVTYIEFWDLTFLINKKWIHKFCNILIEANLGIEYGLPSGTRSEVLDKETLALLKKSGLKRINFSPESGSNHVLKIIKKRANLKNFLKVMREASRAGLYVTSNIVLGFPGERRVDVIKSFIYIVKMAYSGIHDLYLLPYAPYPGSAIFNDLIESGAIDKNNSEYDLFLAKCHYIKIKGIKSYSNSLSGTSINFLFIFGRLFFYFLQYLFRPIRFFYLIKNIIKNIPQTYFERLILGVWRNFVIKRIRR